MAWTHRLAGKAARIVWRITRPRTIGVRAILLDRDGRIALVRHTYMDQWYLPGGGVKKGESIDAALFRELAEEVGVTDARIDRVLGVYHSRREGKDDHIVIFVVRAAEGADDELRRADPAEIEDVRWFPFDQVPADVSSATGRRLAEYRAGAVGVGLW